MDYFDAEPGSSMDQVPDLKSYRKEWADDLDLLRQNRLLDEGAFIRFLNQRGIPAWGVVTGDPGDFHRRGWISSDGSNFDGKPFFHPFRMYPILKLLNICRLNVAVSASLQRDNIFKIVEYVIETKPTISQIGDITRRWDGVIELTILLEPIYWPRITGRYSMPGIMPEKEFKALRRQYRDKTFQLIKSLDPATWRQIHEQLRLDAASMDENDGLYLMLRLSDWSRREQLRGRVAGALWIRHIAEILRRAFEEVHGEHWPEEDEAFGTWYPGARIIAYGSERPLDDALKSKPYLALRFGLFTGSLVRWYVEGETEYFAILETLPEPSKEGIELVNLRGAIQADRDNIALKLRDWLAEDQALRRFSMISFDMDVAQNVKTVRRQVEQKNIIGFIAAHQPDFEFSNFTIQELVEVAARIDEAQGTSGDAARSADWTGITRGRAFEERYKTVSARQPRGLKGEEWGRALAKYAAEHPHREDDGGERPFWRQIRAALQGRIAQYDLQKTRFGFDPNTFELIDLEKTGDQ